MEGPKIRQEEDIKDKLLNIRTDGIREWRKTSLYNRYEPTPYRALKTLFHKYKLSENDHVVDFGSGKGRVVFYAHYKFNCKITGVEANPITYDEAIFNLHKYIHNKKNYNDNINFEFGTAENYDIKKDDNVFYFFNPFSTKIFKQVVFNIISSINKHPRDITIIIFYTIPDYVNFLKNHTPFTLAARVKTPNKTDKYQHFLIYKNNYSKEDSND